MTSGYLVGYRDDGIEDIKDGREDKALFPRNRNFRCTTENPIVLVLDVTSSMQNISRIIRKKFPMIAQELEKHGYLVNPMVSFAAVGDVTCDEAPLQVCDFVSSVPAEVEKQFSRIWIEGGGGAPDWHESYEFMAYFYARTTRIPNAENPFFFFIGDEAFRESLDARDLKKHFGGWHSNIDSKQVFEELKTKFKGNVFLLHRYHVGGWDTEIVKQWVEVLGEERVIELWGDLTIADVILGVIAIRTGKRTLDQYLQDVRSRGESEQFLEKLARSLVVLDPRFIFDPISNPTLKSEVPNSPVNRFPKDKVPKTPEPQDTKITPEKKSKPWKL